MNLTAHFTLEELSFSSTAYRLGIDNTVPNGLLPNMQVLATGLEKVRIFLGFPMYIDSGYRCLALNTMVHGSKNSAHISCFAGDFICPAFGTPLMIVQALAASGIKFDQLIQEGTWVHISFAPAMRQQVLTATFVDGNASYKLGL